MSLLDCLQPRVPPLARGARIVRGAASVAVGEAEHLCPKCGGVMYSAQSKMCRACYEKRDEQERAA